MLTLTLGLAGAIIGVGIIAYAVTIYNRLVRLNKQCDRAWRNIDVKLKQRQDVLEKLVDTTQEYMEYEERTLGKITKLRTKMEASESPQKQATLNEQLTSALDGLFAVAEDYPQLQADSQFEQLQSEIREIEDEIADRREYYNNATTQYNTRINQIPYNVAANMLGYTERELFKARDDVSDVDLTDAFDQ